MVVYNVRIDYVNMNEQTRELIKAVFFNTIERNTFFKDYDYDTKLKILVEGVTDEDVPFKVQDVLKKFPLQMFMDFFEKLPTKGKRELELITLQLHRTHTPPPRPSFMTSMYHRLSRRRSTRTEPTVTKEAYRKWYMKECISFIKTNTNFLLYIDKDVLADREFAKMAVDEHFHIPQANKDFNLEKKLTDTDIDNLKKNILKIEDDIQEINVFIRHYLSFRIKDRLHLRIASRDLVASKTMFKSPISTARINSFLGGNSRRKKRAIRSRRVKYLST